MNRMAKRSASRERDRRGVAVVFALVCLFLAAGLMAVVARMAIDGRHAARDEARRIQTAWLVDSGIERACARLAADPGYSGETWRIAADALDRQHAATVLIEIVRGARADQRVVRVRADFPDDPVDRVRKSKQLAVVVVPR